MDEIILALREFRDERDWSKFHTPKNLAISIAIESGELLEHFQWGGDDHNAIDVDRAAVAAEMADVLIYLLMMFDKLGLDPTKEAIEKIRLNNIRFPIGSKPGKPTKRKP